MVLEIGLVDECLDEDRTRRIRRAIVFADIQIQVI